MPREKTQEEIFVEKRIADQKAKIIARLAELVDGGVNALSKADILYIRARASYLNPMQREIVAKVLPKEKKTEDAK